MRDDLIAAVVQMRNRATLREGLEAADAHVAAARDQGARLVLLPEYFFVPEGRLAVPELAREADTVKAYLQEASRRHGLALAGNVLETVEGGRVHNVAYAFHDGRQVGRQAKVHPMPNELQAGIAPADRFAAFQVGDVSAGFLVCADILYPESSRVLSLQGVDLLLNPVMSPHRAVGDVTQEARTALYIARAWDAAAFVLKAGGFTGDRRAVGRSLIAAPWGILARYEDEWREQVLTARLDLSTLREFRKGHRGFQDRQPQAYGSLIE